MGQYVFADNSTHQYLSQNNDGFQKNLQSEPS
jgi:hypothetical protein